MSIRALPDGSEHRVESLHVGPDSTSWQSSNGKALSSVANSELQLVQFVQCAGLMKGLEEGSYAAEEIFETVDECTGLGCVAMLVWAPLAIVIGAASAVSAGNEKTFVYRSEPICADSPGLEKLKRKRRAGR